MILILLCCWSVLSPEHAQADRCVEQHEREDEQAWPPEHEAEGGMRGGGFCDGDAERDHVGPKRECERRKCCCENESHHDKGRSVLTTANACGERDRSKRAHDGENKQIRPLKPSAHDSEIFDQGIG